MIERFTNAFPRGLFAGPSRPRRFRLVRTSDGPESDVLLRFVTRSNWWCRDLVGDGREIARSGFIKPVMEEACYSRRRVRSIPKTRTTTSTTISVKN